MKEKLINVVIVEPRKPAYEKKIENTLKSLQTIVDGWIEITYPFEDAMVIGNEEAKLIGMAGTAHINGEVYCGPLIICSEDDEGNCASLTNEQIQKYLKMFETPEDIPEEDIKTDLNFYWF